MIAVNRAERIRQRAFLSRHYPTYARLQALAGEVGSIRVGVAPLPAGE